MYTSQRNDQMLPKLKLTVEVFSKWIKSFPSNNSFASVWQFLYFNLFIIFWMEYSCDNDTTRVLCNKYMFERIMNAKKQAHSTKKTSLHETDNTKKAQLPICLSAIHQAVSCSTLKPWLAHFELAIKGLRVLGALHSLKDALKPLKFSNYFNSLHK